MQCLGHFKHQTLNLERVTWRQLYYFSETPIPALIINLYRCKIVAHFYKMVVQYDLSIIHMPFQYSSHKSNKKLWEEEKYVFLFPRWFAKSRGYIFLPWRAHDTNNLSSFREGAKHYSSNSLCWINQIDYLNLLKEHLNLCFILLSWLFMNPCKCKLKMQSLLFLLK